MASRKNILSSIVLIIAAVGIVVRFSGAFLQLAAAFLKGFEDRRTPKKGQSS